MSRNFDIFRTWSTQCATAETRKGRKMNAREYFSHARSLGAFSAADCLELARQAAALDEAAKVRANAGPSLVSRESVTGQQDMSLSFQIKVF
jgi:hypothetical protein